MDSKRVRLKRSRPYDLHDYNAVTTDRSIGMGGGIHTFVVPSNYTIHIDTLCLADFPFKSSPRIVLSFLKSGQSNRGGMGYLATEQNIVRAQHSQTSVTNHQYFPFHLNQNRPFTSPSHSYLGNLRQPVQNLFQLLRKCALHLSPLSPLQRT